MRAARSHSWWHFLSAGSGDGVTGNFEERRDALLDKVKFVCGKEARCPLDIEQAMVPHV